MDEQKKMVAALKLLTDPILVDYIVFEKNGKQQAPIKITFSNAPEVGEEHTFFEKMINFLNKSPNNAQIIARLLPDSTSRRTRMRTQKVSTSEKIANHQLNAITLDVLDIKDFTDKPIKNVTNEELAKLVQHLFLIWRNLPGELRQPRKISDSAIKGYLKLRKEYSHKEIANGLEVYGKWAEAKHKAVQQGDLDSFWFHRWAFDKFLISDKSMGHVDGGWREVVQSKSIPEEYAKLEKLVSKRILNKNIEHIVKGYQQWGEFSIEDNNMFNQTPGLKEAVLERLEELKDAS